jgi:hypothetical protein
MDKIKPIFAKRFSFPENTDFEFDNLVHKITEKTIAQFVDEYDDYIVSQIANTARENGISDLTILNKKAILDAMRKQMPRKPELAKSGLYGNCAVCGKVVHIGNRYCDNCGQALDWEVTDG